MVVACAIVLPGCQTPTAPAPLPPGPRVVDLEMTDFAFRYEGEIPSGRVLLRVRNTGRVAHSFSLVPLTDDVPPIHDQLSGPERRAIPPFAAVTARQPGSGTTMAVDLVPGLRYAFVCFLVTSQGDPHWARGMASEFRAGR